MLALGTAKSMNYLHKFPTPVIHRDLKSLNVLIGENLVPKIADFGWTRLKGRGMTSKVGKESNHRHLSVDGSRSDQG